MKISKGYPLFVLKLTLIFSLALTIIYVSTKHYFLSELNCLHKKYDWMEIECSDNNQFVSMKVKKKGSDRIFIVDLKTHKITAEFPWFLGSEYDYIPCDRNNGIPGKIKVSRKFIDDSSPWILPFKQKVQKKDDYKKYVFGEISPDRQKVLYLCVEKGRKPIFYVSDVDGRKKKRLPEMKSLLWQWGKDSESIFFFPKVGNLCKYDLKNGIISPIFARDSGFGFEILEDSGILNFVGTEDKDGKAYSTISKVSLKGTGTITKIHQTEGNVYYFSTFDFGKRFYVMTMIRTHLMNYKYRFYCYDSGKREMFSIAESNNYMEFVKQISPDKCIYTKEDSLYEFNYSKKRSKKLFPKGKWGLF